jgi:hypothetical protein
LEPGSIFEPKGYKGTSVIMYVFNWSLSPNIYFILYVRNFQKFIYPRNYLSKTYKIIQFSNVRFQIMYVFRKNVQNASFPCGCHVSHSNFILYVFFNFPVTHFFSCPFFSSIFLPCFLEYIAKICYVNFEIICKKYYAFL